MGPAAKDVLPRDDEKTAEFPVSMSRVVNGEPPKQAGQVTKEMRNPVILHSGQDRSAEPPLCFVVLGSTRICWSLAPDSTDITGGLVSRWYASINSRTVDPSSSFDAVSG